MMATYFVNVKENVSNVKVYIIKKRLKGDTNKFSKLVESLIHKYMLKEATSDNK